MTNQIFKSFVFFLLVCQAAFADKVKLLSKDADALQARVDLIQQAKKEILVEYFSVWNDDQSVGGFALLLEAAQRGVKVKVVMDALSNTVPRSLISALLLKGKGADGAQNFELKVYNPLSLNLLKATHRDHAKMLIVDDRIMISGGRNVGDKYFGFNATRNYKDLDVIITGDVVHDAHENYLKVWSSKLTSVPNLYQNAPEKLAVNACMPSDDRYDQCESARQRAFIEYNNEIVRIQKLMDKLISFSGDKKGLATNSGTDWTEKMSETSSIKFLSHEVELVNKVNNTMTRQLREIVMAAKSEIRIISPYLIPTDGVYEVFQALIDRGVAIRIITNSLRSTDNLFAQAGYRVGKDRLIAMGVEINEFNGPNTLHAKVAVVDKKIGLVGTYNLDPRSAQKNREVGFAIEGNQELIDDLNAQFEGALEISTLVAKDKVRYNEDMDFKDVSDNKKSLLEALMFITPLIKNQL